MHGQSSVRLTADVAFAEIQTIAFMRAVEGEDDVASQEQGGNSYKLSLTGAGIKVDRAVDASVASQILHLVLGDGQSPAGPNGPSEPQSGTPTRSSRTRKKTAATASDGKPKARRKAASPGIVKDLSMRPKGKKSFADFVAEKSPTTHQEKQTVIVHWLRHEAGMTSGVTPDHVNSCYVEAGWPRPSDLSNALAVTSTKKGWLDTSTTNDIKITTRGEDEVNHKLPRPAKKSK